MSSEASDSSSLPPATAPLSLEGLKTRPIAGRRHLVCREQFAKPVEVAASLEEFLDALPSVLAVECLRELGEAMAVARAGGHHVLMGLGGHVIKVGLGPLIADMIERGLVTGVVLNGSSAIHDLEIALHGQTSERVSETIADGSFGMITETASIFARVFARGAEDERGLGVALAEELEAGDYAFKEDSLVYRAARAGAAVTVHVAIGTDTVHAVPGASGAAIGAASHIDFRRLAAVVTKLSKGVYINVGSAVVLPEVFLKCVSVARNLGASVEDLTTANLDMVQHYRPRRNVLERPSSRGFALTGHHELLLPLLRVVALRSLAKHGGAPVGE